MTESILLYPDTHRFLREVERRNKLEPVQELTTFRKGFMTVQKRQAHEDAAYPDRQDAMYFFDPSLDDRARAKSIPLDIDLGSDTGKVFSKMIDTWRSVITRDIFKWLLDSIVQLIERYSEPQFWYVNNNDMLEGR